MDDLKFLHDRYLASLELWFSFDLDTLFYNIMKLEKSNDILAVMRMKCFLEKRRLNLTLSTYVERTESESKLISIIWWLLGLNNELFEKSLIFEMNEFKCLQILHLVDLFFLLFFRERGNLVTIYFIFLHFMKRKKENSSK